MPRLTAEQGYSVKIGKLLHARMIIVAAAEGLNEGQYAERELALAVAKSEARLAEHGYQAARQAAHIARKAAPMRHEYFPPGHPARRGCEEGE